MKNEDLEGTFLKVIGGLFIIFVLPFIVYGMTITVMIKGWGLEPKSWPWVIGIYGVLTLMLVGIRGLNQLSKMINKK